MLIHNEPLISIFFGDVRNKFRTKDFLNVENSKKLLELEPFKSLKKTMKLKAIDFLKQVHENKGVYIATEEEAINLKPFSVTGDYLITQLSHIGLGIVTADCLPIIIYDNFNQAVAIVHASWKSSLEGISIKVVKRMQELFDTKLENLIIFFGPSAKPCCYEVDKEFEEKLKVYDFADEVLYKRGEKLFFDLPAFNILQLESIGVDKESFKLNYNDCTICDESYCSQRRNGNDFRQMTVVTLK